MRYFLKLAKVIKNASGDVPVNTGWFEEVDEYTHKNAKYALNDSGDGPRYTNDAVTVNGDEVCLRLDAAPLRDLAILTRYFQAIEPMKVEGGFIREQPPIKFNIRGRIKLREKDGSIWSKAA
jgi:hypothetical protein